MITIYKTDDGRVAPSDYLPTSEASVEIGTMLNLVDGVLVKVTGTTKPTYLSLTRRAVKSGETIPVTRLCDDMILEAETDVVDFSGVKLGDKCALDATGAVISSVDDGGHLEVVGIYEKHKTLLVRAV